MASELRTDALDFEGRARTTELMYHEAEDLAWHVAVIESENERLRAELDARQGVNAARSRAGSGDE